MEVKAAGA